MNDIAAIKARREAVTPGVWGVDGDKIVVWGENGRYYAIIALGALRADAAFIAAAPADIDTLLAEVERLTSQLGNARDCMDGQGEIILALRSERDAQATDLAYLRSYVHALERYVPEASRRVAAGEARTQLEQQGEGV